MQYLLKQLPFFILLSISVISNSYADSTINSRAALEKALAEHKGNVVYLDFWASWCGPCRKSFPWMNKIAASYKQQGFSVISVNLDANRDLAMQFLIETPASFDVIYAVSYTHLTLPTIYSV